MKAPLKPWVSARDAGEPESSALVTLLVDTEERIARPSAPPTCWVVLRSPEASPDSLAGTPLVAEIVIGTNESPRPAPRATIAGRTGLGEAAAPGTPGGGGETGGRERKAPRRNRLRR